MRTVFVITALILHYIYPPLFNPSLSFSADRKFFIISLYIMYIMNIGAMMALLFYSNQCRYLNSNMLCLGLGLFIRYAVGLCIVTLPLFDVNFAVILCPVAAFGFVVIAAAFFYPLPAYKQARMRERLIKSYRLRRIWEYFCRLLPDIMSFGLIIFLGMFYQIFGALFMGGLAVMFMIWLRQFMAIREVEHILKRISINRKKLKQENEKLAHQSQLASCDASVDYLTKLYNRRYIDRAINRPKESEDGKIRVGLLLIDVDYFKQVNDKLGHDAGDKVLTKVADAIKNAVNEKDVGGRFGGDEFIIILYDVSEETVTLAAHLIQEHIWGDEYLAEIPVTLSIGGSAWQGNIKDYNSTNLLKTADNALYQSKENGRDCYHFLPTV